MAALECGGSEGYRDLRDVRIELNSEMVRGGGEGFAVSFWLYLSSSARPYSVIFHQIAAGDDYKLPFLALGEGNKLLLFRLRRLHREAPISPSSYPWTDTTNLSAIIEGPLEKWFHMGCEVTEKAMRLHIDGNLITGAHLCSLSNEPDHQDDANLISLVGSDDKLEGYVYNIQVSHILGTIQEHYAKNPPFKLSIDFSCCDGIEEGEDGIWNIVGGKASCRRNLILKVVLIDAFGEAVKDREVVASLVYADNGMIVEKSRGDSEPPLLIVCEGLECAAISRPIPVIRGHALFKLKISQAYSKPIRCISRHRTNRPLGSGKLVTSATMDETNRLIDDQGSVNVDNVNGHSQSLVGSFHPSMSVKLDDGVGKSDTHNMVSQNKHAREMVASREAHNIVGTDSSTSDCGSFDAGSSWSGSDGDEMETVSDEVIFRYCLDSTYERSKFLRGAAPTFNKDDLVKLADGVSLYSGCSHHRKQILMSKQLLQEGADTWSMISKSNERALWSSAIPEIITKFMGHSTKRGLSEQDLEVLRGIAGCGDDIGRDEFERLWYWLYSVAASLSRGEIKKLWNCTAPTWIEGLITREEAENALRGSKELLKHPGTFILRFPTTRSWPHPDAGSLVVTYVGIDNSIHHSLLSLDSCDARVGSVQDLLLQEPELCQLGRVERLPTAK